MDKKSLDGLALLHDLVPFLPVDRLHALLNNRILPDEATGAALFADISGFTALAETLAAEHGPERGAEELNSQVNLTFVGLIDAVDRFHGSVLEFSGDSLTAWFAGENAALRATTAAIAMQLLMQTYTDARLALQLKIGIGSGATRRFCPGDPALGVYDVLTGPAIDQVAQAEAYAAPGQIVLSPTASAEVGTTFPQVALGNGFMRLKPTIVTPQAVSVSRWPSIRWLDHADRSWELVEACRPYLPAPLYERLQSGHGTYMADLRTATPLFVRFTGLDYDTATAAQQLDDLVRATQQIVAQHGGYLSEVNVGEKGSLLVALFGAPVALENPAASAAQAALTLHDGLPHIKFVQIGLTCGRLFAGTVGGPMRRAYAVIGDEVNLAARLMMTARPGDTLANTLVYEMGTDFAWEALPPMRLKGKVAPTRVYRLLGVAAVTKPLFPAGRIVARTQELEALAWVRDATQQHQQRLLIIQGEPGLGKSHLIGEFAALLRERGISPFTGAGRSVEQQVPYRAWRDIFAAYFDLDRRTPHAHRQEQVIARLREINPALPQLAPLLNDLLDLGFPENMRTADLEPVTRHSALVKLLIMLLRAWLAEDALGLIIDNAQWLDTASWELLYRITQQLTDHPLSLLLAIRPFAEGAAPPTYYAAIRAMPQVRELILAPLIPEDAMLLAAAQLGAERLSSPVRELLTQKSGGNPLFIKELTGVLRESDLITITAGEAVLNGEPQTLQIPDTIQGVVRSRIDRLPPDQQILLKVGAVIGAQFSFRTLQAVQPLRLSEAQLRDNLDALCNQDLQRLETLDDDQVFAFRYTITRDVAYGSLSFSQRRQLHRAVALWYEYQYRDNLTPYYSLLAYHWREAEHFGYERRYSFLAGRRAAHQSDHAKALSYLERALALAADDRPDQQLDALLPLETLYHLSGDRARQREALARWEALLTVLSAGQSDQVYEAELTARRARYHISMADYEAASAAAQRAFALADAIQDEVLMGMSNILWGQALQRLGNYTAACQRLTIDYTGGAKHIEAQRYHALGVAHYMAGDLEAAQDALANALAHSEAAGDRATFAGAHDYLGRIYERWGDYEQAVWFYLRAVAVCREIGYRQGEADALTRRGALALQTGDFEQALHLLEQALAINRAIDGRAGEAETLNRLGRLAYERGDYPQAADQLAAALTIQQATGDRYGSGQTLLDLAMTAAAQNDLAAAERDLGAALALDREIIPQQRVIEQFVGFGLMALLALRLGNQAAALSHVEAVLETIETYGLAVFPYAADISLICHEVFTACGEHERAFQVLRAAHAFVMSRANRIVDLERRSRYLLTVPGNRAVIDRYEQS